MDMSGKVCLVTGATDGIGKVTAQVLAERGATVIGVGRNPDKIKAVLAEVDKAGKVGKSGGSLSFLNADLSSMTQVRQLADEFKRQWDHLDVLINNAGALFSTYRENVDGIELTFVLNHLAYFLLTNLLLERLSASRSASQAARVINVASDAHEGRTIDFDDLNHRKHYDGWQAYGESKLANILFTYELARRVDSNQITVNAVHPGFVNTNFQNAAGLNMRGPLSPDEGADTLIWLATSPDVAGVTGKYFVRRQTIQSSAVSHDEHMARRLWEVSAELTGLRSTVKG